jgi:uroporphyrinogen decarboxylase
MYGAPAAWHRFADLIADVIGEHLVGQIEAGVDAVQLFDSWVGALNASDYREFILPHTRRIFETIAPFDVPAIHFGVGTGAILSELRAAGGDVIGVDWRTPIDEAWQRVGLDRAIQGNLDPTVLLGPLDRIMAATDEVLDRAGGRTGHIFNLGHGILPGTSCERVQAVARYVHQRTRQ